MTIDDRGRRAAHQLHGRAREGLDSRAALHATVAGPSRRFRPPRLAAAAALVAAMALAGTLVASTAGNRAGEQVGTAEGATRAVAAATAPPASQGTPAATAADPGPVPEDLGLPVTVEPSSGLQPGQEVTVTGEGFTPGQEVGVVMCTLSAHDGAIGPDGCDLTDYVYATPDAEGRVTATRTVERVVATAHDGTVDCASGAVHCGIAMGQLNDFGVAGGAPVSFAAGLPVLEVPTVSVSATTGLRHGDAVTISGSGFSGDLRSVALCRVVGGEPHSALGNPGCWPLLTSRGVDDPALVGADGSFSIEVPVWRVFPSRLPDVPAVVDCAADSCAVVVDAIDSLSAPAVPVAFDPAGPRPEAPVLTATPTDGLQAGDLITVVVTGLAPGATAVVGGCGAVTPTGGCTGVPLMTTEAQDFFTVEVQADADGRAEATVPAPDPDGFSCVADDPCGLVVGSLGGEPTLSSAAVPISYAG